MLQLPPRSVRAHAAALRGETMNEGAWGYGNDFYACQFWRFVLVQEVVKGTAMTSIDFPPMQKAARFNLEAVKEQIEAT